MASSFPPASGTAPVNDYDGNRWCYLTQNDTNTPKYVKGGTATLTSPEICIEQSPAIIHYAVWYSNGMTSWDQPWSEAQVDLLKVYVKDHLEPDVWTEIQAARVGPFAIQSMTGWFEYAVLISEAVLASLPENIDLQFRASGTHSECNVEAAVDWVRVLKLPAPGE